MKTIHKYVLPCLGAPEACSVEMPVESVILHVGLQKNRICIWAEVDTDKPMRNRHFRVFGTGHKKPDGTAYMDQYLGTIFYEWFVFHVYEEL